MGDVTVGNPITSSSGYTEHGYLFRLQTNARWALAGFLIVLPVMSVIVLLVYTRMERKKTNVLNIQLATVNLFSAVVLLPLFYSFYQIFTDNGLAFINGAMKRLIRPDAPNDRAVNRSFCISLALCYYITSSLHFLTLLALSIDRFMAVFFPFLYRRVPVKYYKIATVAMWVIIAALPLLGFFSSRKAGENTDLPKIRPAFFEFYPYPITYHQEAFCEIHFSSIEMTGRDEKDMISTGQKVYCFILMGIPFIISPFITLVLSVATLFKLTRISMKRNNLRAGKNLFHHGHHGHHETQTTHLLDCGKIMKTCCRVPKSGQEIQLHEMYENRTTIVETDCESSEQNRNYAEGGHRSKTHMNVHLQAFLTLVLLMVIFLLCDALWWLTTVGDIMVYILGRRFSVLSYTGLFGSETQLVIFPIASRCGPLIYAVIVPFLMLWRQKPFREQFFGIFRDAKTVVTELTTGNGRVDE